MSENTNAGRVSIPLQRELEPSAEELLRLVMDNFFVNHKGGIEWGIKEGYPLAEVVGATMERNLAKYLPEKSVIKYNEKNGLKTDSDDNSKKERIDELCKTHGSLRKTAKAVDVDFGYLSGLRSGDKTSPSETILEKLGLKREVHYVLK